MKVLSDITPVLNDLRNGFARDDVVALVFKSDELARAAAWEIRNDKRRIWLVLPTVVRQRPPEDWLDAVELVLRRGSIWTYRDASWGFCESGIRAAVNGWISGREVRVAWNAWTGLPLDRGSFDALSRVLEFRGGKAARRLVQKPDGECVQTRDGKFIEAQERLRGWVGLAWSGDFKANVEMLEHLNVGFSPLQIGWLLPLGRLAVHSRIIGGRQYGGCRGS
jgi:hypothetical protein